MYCGGGGASMFAMILGLLILLLHCINDLLSSFLASLFALFSTWSYSVICDFIEPFRIATITRVFTCYYSLRINSHKNFFNNHNFIYIIIIISFEIILFSHKD